MTKHAESETPARRARRRLPLGWICGFAAWMTAAGAALAAMSDLASQPGAPALAPTSWPTASRLARTPGRGTLVMVAHTKCACTRASLRELERVMARAGSRVEAFVVFVGPRDSNADGVLDLRTMAGAMKNVRVIEDETEARIFGAATSGQVLLYAESDALVFRGGITVARGHEGDSAGGEIVRRFAVTGHVAPSSGPSTTASEVFGCALYDNHDSGTQAPGARRDP